jgi:hypothetical protein
LVQEDLVEVGHRDLLPIHLVREPVVLIQYFLQLQQLVEVEVVMEHHLPLLDWERRVDLVVEEEVFSLPLQELEEQVILQQPLLHRAILVVHQQYPLRRVR